MADFAKILYEKFLMRDVLGKVAPGGIVVLILLQAIGYPLSVLSTLKLPESGLAYFIVLPLFYLIGVALQIIAELLGLHSASPRPRYVFFRPATGNWAKLNEDFDARLAIIKSAPTDKWIDGAKEQRERFVYLKEGSGNMAIALLIAAVILLVKIQGYLFLICFTISIILYKSHIMHAERQAKYEINTLFRSGLIEKDVADKMRDRLEIKKYTSTVLDPFWGI